jgi:hypothetical protein
MDNCYRSEQRPSGNLDWNMDAVSILLYNSIVNDLVNISANIMYPHDITPAIRV